MVWFCIMLFLFVYFWSVLIQLVVYFFTTHNFAIFQNTFGDFRANVLKEQLNCLRKFICLLEVLSPQHYLHGEIIPLAAVSFTVPCSSDGSFYIKGCLEQGHPDCQFWVLLTGPKVITI